MGSRLLSPGSWCTQGFVCALQESVSQSCGGSVTKSHWPPKSNSLGVLSPLPDPQVRKSAVGYRVFITVWGLLWFNCSPVYWSSARWLYGRANGDLLPEDLRQMVCLLGLLQPEPLSPQQATADPCLCRRHSKAGLAQALWGPWVLVHTRFCLSSLSISVVGMGFDSKHNFAPPTILLGLCLCPLTWGIFLMGSNIPLMMVVQQ